MPRMIGETRLHAETLPTYLELWDSKARLAFLDSLSCYLHNEGHNLTGNTEGFDVEWLARTMYAKRTGGTLSDIERASDDTRQEYKALAAVAIECLPELCERMASRYLTALAAIKTEIERTRAAVAVREEKMHRKPRRS
jgi:hypothetical protein